MDTSTFMVQMPVFLIETFNKHGKINISTSTFGEICAVNPPCFSISICKKQYCNKDIIERKTFTVNIPNTNMANKVDYARCYKYSDVNLVSHLDLATETAEHVDAPYFTKCSVVLELLCTHNIVLNSHTNFIAGVMDVKIKQDCLDKNNIPSLNHINPLFYVPLPHEYWNTGNLIARAFSTSTKIFKHA